MTSRKSSNPEITGKEILQIANKYPRLRRKPQADSEKVWLWKRVKHLSAGMAQFGRLTAEPPVPPAAVPRRQSQLAQRECQWHTLAVAHRHPDQPIRAPSALTRRDPARQQLLWRRGAHCYSSLSRGVRPRRAQEVVGSRDHFGWLCHRPAHRGWWRSRRPCGRRVTRRWFVRREHPRRQAGIVGRITGDTFRPLPGLDVRCRYWQARESSLLLRAVPRRTARPPDRHHPRATGARVVGQTDPRQ